VAKLTVYACLFGRPLSEKHPCIPYLVGVVDGIRDLAHETLLGVDSEFGRQIDIRNGHLMSPSAMKAV
jgi:hypothetical protein